MEKLMTENRQLANEIRQWLLDHEMWIDVNIYFDGVAYSTDDGKHFYYNDPDHLVELEDQDPRKYFEYVGNPHILSMSFEGPLYELINYEDWSEQYQEFVDLFEKHGLLFELGNAWNLTCFRL